MNKLAEQLWEDAGGNYEVHEEETPLDAVCEEAVKASQYLYVIGQMEADQDKIANIAGDQIETIENWQSMEDDKLQRRIDWLAMSLEGWTRAQEAETGKKSVKLPNGELKLRAQQAKMEVDRDFFFDGNPPDELIRVIPVSLEPDKKAIREAIKETGEVPQGVTWEESTRPKFTYKVKITETE